MFNQKHFFYPFYLQYASDFPTILLGNFNSSPNEIDATIQPLLDEKLGIRSVDLAWGNLTHSFDSELPHSRLDYIFITISWNLSMGCISKRWCNIRSFTGASDFSTSKENNNTLGGVVSLAFRAT